MRRGDEDPDVFGAAGHDHLRQAERAGDGQPVGGAGAKAVEELVADLAHRVVEDRADDALPHHQLHRASAGADGVEHDRLVAALGEEPLGVQRALGEHAEVGDADERLVALPALPRELDLDLRHAVRGAGGVGQHLPHEAVQAEDVADREHHRDVRDADVGRGVARRDRRDHHLGQAVGQRPHHHRAGRRALQPAEADDAVQPCAPRAAGAAASSRRPPSPAAWPRAWDASGARSAWCRRRGPPRRG